ncbi:MAG: hypothetical protein GX039_03700 [Clostridia bacterium]|nr:hypothetical protein [Clostridia bacterium]
MSTKKEVETLYAGYDYHKHVHDHSGKTSCDRGHAHLHPGVTGPPIPYDCSHYHNLCGITTFDFGHTHAYNAMTGPAIELPDGMHTHAVQFETNVVEEHSHRVMGFVVPSRK